ncbi:MAG TPA: exodeoxyribonuclease VII large subunit [Caldilineae bacterium]|nr:exodeoxyribonuclease VII large subunit [Caldilineae bacterium]
MQLPVYTVSQLTSYIKGLFLQDEVLQDVWVEGEVSNFSRAASGHRYFTLKDADAALHCVMWRHQAVQLTREPQDGDAVLAHGYLSVYEPRGLYQLYVDFIQPAGLGKLYLEFEALKARLEAEGLFASDRKRPIPPWPRRIGVVTSADAAALRDILRTLAARYPLVEVVLASTLVQGAEAPPQIVEAIVALNRWSEEREPIDVLILARGGGSLEELWAFNDERVVRAIVASRIPVISGVGHETDFTLADFAADRRAPTPTGAAMMAVPDARELSRRIAEWRERLIALISARLAEERQRVERLTRELQRTSPAIMIAERRQRVDELSRALGVQMQHLIALRRAQVEGMRARLEGLNPMGVLQRGYAIVRRADSGKVIRSVQQVSQGLPLRVRVMDGEFGVLVDHDHLGGQEGEDG